MHAVGYSPDTPEGIAPGVEEVARSGESQVGFHISGGRTSLGAQRLRPHPDRCKSPSRNLVHRLLVIDGRGPPFVQVWVAVEEQMLRGVSLRTLERVGRRLQFRTLLECFQCWLQKVQKAVAAHMAREDAVRLLVRTA